MKKTRVYIPIAVLVLITVISVSVLIGEAEKSFIPTTASIFDAPTLIIDPGHGGADGGAVSDSGVIESAINLDISLKMRDISALFGVSPVMTRESDELNYPSDADTIGKMKRYDQHTRLDLISSLPNSVLISIHQNTFPSSKPFGAQVLYAKSERSDEFGSAVQTALRDTLDPDNYRPAARISDSIYLFKSLSCPAILIECGFLSNPTEEALLITNEYRLKLAMTIFASYLNFFVLNG